MDKRPKLDNPNALIFDPGTKPLTGWEIALHNKGMKDGFEKGVDAGRKWGREEKDEEWREAIHRALRNHTEQFVYGHEKIIPVEHIEALL